MPAQQNFDKRRKIVGAKGQLRPEGEVVESGVINSFGDPGLIAIPMAADVTGQSEPAVEVVGDAGPNATRI